MREMTNVGDNGRDDPKQHKAYLPRIWNVDTRELTSTMMFSGCVGIASAMSHRKSKHDEDMIHSA